MVPEILFSTKTDYWRPLEFICALLIIVIIAIDLMGQSKKDYRFYSKGTIVGAVGIMLAIIYAILASAYQLYTVHG